MHVRQIHRHAVVVTGRNIPELSKTQRRTNILWVHAAPRAKGVSPEMLEDTV